MADIPLTTFSLCPYLLLAGPCHEAVYNQERRFLWPPPCPLSGPPCTRTQVVYESASGTESLLYEFRQDMAFPWSMALEKYNQEVRLSCSCCHVGGPSVIAARMQSKRDLGTLDDRRPNTCPRPYLRP